MKVTCCVHGERFQINVGDGKQHVRWLGLVAAGRYKDAGGANAKPFRIPQRILNMEGTVLRPRAALKDELKDGDEVRVELREGAFVGDELEHEDIIWIDEAYGALSNLRVIKFQWQLPKKGSSGLSDTAIPAKVRGDYFVAAQWLPVFPQREYGGKFEIPLDPVDVGDGGIEWVATKRAPPGSANYRFVLEDGTETVCKGLPASTISPDGTHHREDFGWEVPIAHEPYPDMLEEEQAGRPSTASSVEGAEIDPRFDEDWDSMKLRWVEPHMRLRVKDVLKEFYSILIDLYDSYAFMGLDLAVDDPSSQGGHTIGLDDMQHLLLQANLLSKGNSLPKFPRGLVTGVGASGGAGAKGGAQGKDGAGGLPVPWTEVCKWYEDATQCHDGKPYLSQRLQRNHYLEVLLRVAHWVQCEHPPPSKQKDHIQMPLDEGLFRFLTDILIPIMDLYDDDPVRKDAVQHENLVAIQRARPNLRSIYSFLSQHPLGPPDDGEHCLRFPVLNFIFEFGKDLLGEGAGAPAAAGGGGGDKKDKDGGDDAGGDETDQHVAMFHSEAAKLGHTSFNLVLQHCEAVVAQVTRNHLEGGADEDGGDAGGKSIAGRHMLFWEFFEFVMQMSRIILVTKGDAQNTGLHVVVTQLVNAVAALVKIIDGRQVDLPLP